MKKLAFPPERVRDVLVNWYEVASDRHYSYEVVPGSMKSNKHDHRLTCVLSPKDKGFNEDHFGMVIHHTDETTTVKMDELEDPYDAILLTAPDELLVYAVDESSEIYIHLYLE